MDLLLVAVMVVAEIVVGLFVIWLVNEREDATKAEGARELPGDAGVLIELERLWQKPPGPFI